MRVCDANVSGEREREREHSRIQATVHYLLSTSRRVLCVLDLFDEYVLALKTMARREGGSLQHVVAPEVQARVLVGPGRRAGEPYW